MGALRFAVGADERGPLVEHVLGRLAALGHLAQVWPEAPGGALRWPQVAEQVALAVRSGACDQGILFCWTGTGVSIAANKVPGVRAALCADAATAAGARRWNDANVLVLSLRATSQAVAGEILDAWLAHGPDAGEAANIAELSAIEARHGAPAGPG
jgi:ribose 5-phosphate isomerase B